MNTTTRLDVPISNLHPKRTDIVEKLKELLDGQTSMNLEVNGTLDQGSLILSVSGTADTEQDVVEMAFHVLAHSVSVKVSGDAGRSGSEAPTQ